VENTPDPGLPRGRHAVVAARAEAPTMPVVSHDALWRSPNLIPTTAGQRYTLGWQDARVKGRCFVVARLGAMRERILHRFPLTEDGWVRAWAALVELDADGAQAVAKTVREFNAARTARIAQTERQAEVYEAFASAGGPTIFRSLGVQVLARDGTVYTIGDHSIARKIDTSRLLGPLAGAQAMVTDGAQSWSPGRAMFLPIALTGLATKTKADAAVVFADGTVHTAALDGNNAVREAQKQVVQFNAMAGASAPTATETRSDPAAKLRKLQELRDAGLLTDQEYATKRAEVIDSI
jgi:Short C-terminal domain